MRSKIREASRTASGRVPVQRLASVAGQGVEDVGILRKPMRIPGHEALHRLGGEVELAALAFLIRLRAQQRVDGAATLRIGREIDVLPAHGHELGRACHEVVGNRGEGEISQGPGIVRRRGFDQALEVLDIEAGRLELVPGELLAADLLPVPAELEAVGGWRAVPELAGQPKGEHQVVERRALVARGDQRIQNLRSTNAIGIATLSRCAQNAIQCRQSDRIERRLLSAYGRMSCS